MNYVFMQDGHMFIRRTLEMGGLRILAHPSQVPLLDRFHAEEVEICSVSQLKWSKKPEVVLDRMEAVDRKIAGRFGGWRRPVPEELIALRFSHSAQGKRLLDLTAKELAFVDQHPLIRAGIGFGSNGVISIPMLSLMVNIYDLRRFTDPEHPDRLSRLKAYYRLTTPAAIRRIVSQKSAPFNEDDELAQSCMLAWQEGPLHIVSEELAAKLPWAFLLRYFLWWQEKFPEAKWREGCIQASWRTTQYFMSWVRRLWLARIDREEFNPDTFFEKGSPFLRGDEAQEFRAYIKHLDNALDNFSGPK